MLHDLLAPLDHTLFALGADQVNAAELLGFLTGAVGVWLTVRSKLANFPVGLANNVFYLLLFLDARLYADASLQIAYFALGVAGWWQWLYGGERRTPLRTSRRVTTPTWLALAAVLVLGTVGLTALLRAVGDSAPFWDAFTTAMSFVAQWLLNTKKVANWYFWIAADLVYVPLYASKHLYLTAAVYVLFLGLCGRGLAVWRAAVVEAPDRAPAVVPIGEVA